MRWKICLREVNHRLYRASLDNQAGMSGSTIVALLAFERHCLSIWAGDSRVYRSREGCARTDHAGSQRGAGAARRRSRRFSRSGSLERDHARGGRIAGPLPRHRAARAAQPRPLSLVQRRPVPGALGCRHGPSPHRQRSGRGLQGADETGAERHVQRQRLRHRRAVLHRHHERVPESSGCARRPASSS